MYIINRALFIIIAFAALLFTACEKDPVDLNIEPIAPIEVDVVEKSENTLIMSGGKMSITGFTMDCITITYPFDFELESGATIEVNDSIDVELALSNVEDYVIDFIYPIEAVNQDGSAFTINNIEELAEAFIECVPIKGWGEFEEEGFPAFDFEGLCVDLTYPFSLLSYNGATMLVNNEQEFANALATGYYYFSFPINVIDHAGSAIVIVDGMVLMETLFDCESYYYHGPSICPFDLWPCYKIAYPVALIDIEDNTIIVNNEDELYSLLFSTGVVDFVYPITLISTDGATVDANDANTINELIKECYGYDYYYIDTLDYYYYSDSLDYYYYYYSDSLDYYFPFELCFQVQFPVQVTYYSGDTLTANSQEELNALLYSGLISDFVYPITITTEYGETKTLNSKAELYELCSFFENEEYNEYYYGLNFEDILGLLLIVESGCFEVDFPFSITIDGIENTLNSKSELESIAEELFSSQSTPEVEINFPFTVTLNSNGSKLTIENIDDLYEYSYNCP